MTREKLLIDLQTWEPLITASRTSKTPKSGDLSISTENWRLMDTLTDLITIRQLLLSLHQSRFKTPKFPLQGLHITTLTIILRNLSQNRPPKRPYQRKCPNQRLPARNLPLLQRKKNRKRSLKRQEPAASPRKPPKFSSQRQRPKRFPKNAKDDPRSVRLPKAVKLLRNARSDQKTERDPKDARLLKSQRDLESEQDPKASRNLRDISLSIGKLSERNVETIDKSLLNSEKRTAKLCAKKLSKTRRTHRKKLSLQRKI